MVELHLKQYVTPIKAQDMTEALNLNERNPSESYNPVGNVENQSNQASQTITITL